MPKRTAKPPIDVQARRDRRHIAIDQVGVKDILYPITVLDREARHQHTVARVSMTVNLPHRFKGTHMSRFVELLNEHCRDMSTSSIPSILRAMRARLKAETAHLEARFPYFLLKRAPVSGAAGLMAYECVVQGEGTPRGVRLAAEVRVPITAVCPCSKAISERGAHNQRGLVTVRFGFARFVWLEEIIRIAETSASCEVYSVLKREDEKWVTERAYDRPMFVEDVARTAARKLARHGGLSWFSVEVENHESIHAHSAYARIDAGPETS
jgi:GTP cyclohydrolase I